MRGGLPDGTDRPQIVERHGDQLVVRHTNKRAKQEIGRLIGEGELPANATLQTMPKWSDGQPEIEFNIGTEETSTLGTPEAGKSVLKTTITASAMGGFDREDIARGIRHLRNEGRGVVMLGVCESAIRSTAGREYGLKKRRRWICVHVESDEAEHRVWGYVELFGTFKWIAAIGEKALKVQAASFTRDFAMPAIVHHAAVSAPEWRSQARGGRARDDRGGREALCVRVVAQVSEQRRRRILPARRRFLANQTRHRICWSRFRVSRGAVTGVENRVSPVGAATTTRLSPPAGARQFSAPLRDVQAIVVATLQIASAGC